MDVAAGEEGRELGFGRGIGGEGSLRGGGDGAAAAGRGAKNSSKRSTLVGLDLSNCNKST